MSERLQPGSTAPPVLSARVRAAQVSFEPVGRFQFWSRYGQRRLKPGIADLTFGNPHEMPLPGLVEALRSRAVPADENWFAYKASEEGPQKFVAERLAEELSLPFEPNDVGLTSGAFAAIAVAMHLVADPGDEVIYSEPAWFCYEPILLAAGLTARKIRLTPPRFDLDLDAIESAIGPKTRLVIVTTPHNPTGRIYDKETLVRLAEMLERASTRVGHRVFLLSDEPYRRLRFDGRSFTTPAAVYPWTLISYSYGKVLLAPGQRLGYLAVSPLMPPRERQVLQSGLFNAQMALGWCFPSAVMQAAIPDLEDLTIDVMHLTRRRDRLMEALSAAGYQPLLPEGTFYLWSKWPNEKHMRLWNALADRDVFVMPGTILGAPEYFRISLTASDEMIDKALPALAEVAAPFAAALDG